MPLGSDGTYSSEKNIWFLGKAWALLYDLTAEQMPKHRIHAGKKAKKQSETLLDRRGEIEPKKRYTLIYFVVEEHEQMYKKI